MAVLLSGETLVALSFVVERIDLTDKAFVAFLFLLCRLISVELVLFFRLISPIIFVLYFEFFFVRLNFCVDLCYYYILILASCDLREYILFECEHGLSDNLMVVFECILTH